MGIEAEAGGSAFSKVMTQMQVAVETNNAALADFARVSGMSSEQFVQAWKQGPADAIQAFIVGLSQMDEEGISAHRYPPRDGAYGDPPARYAAARDQCE